jgi:hypothetical protein
MGEILQDKTRMNSDASVGVVGYITVIGDTTITARVIVSQLKLEGLEAGFASIVVGLLLALPVTIVLTLAGGNNDCDKAATFPNPFRAGTDGGVSGFRLGRYRF